MEGGATHFALSVSVPIFAPEDGKKGELVELSIRHLSTKEVLILSHIVPTAAGLSKNLPKAPSSASLELKDNLDLKICFMNCMFGVELQKRAQKASYLKLQELMKIAPRQGDGREEERRRILESLMQMRRLELNADMAQAILRKRGERVDIELFRTIFRPSV